MKRIMLTVACVSVLFLMCHSLGFPQDNQDWGGQSHKFEHSVQPGYSINVISPKEGQKFQPGEEVEIEIIVEGSPNPPSTFVMLGKESAILEGTHAKTKLKLDDKYTGEAELILGIAGGEGVFIGSKSIKIFVGDKESTQGPKWDETRQIKELEWDYIGMSQEIKSPELCYKISPRAVYSAGFAPNGSQIQYARSMCFSSVAYELKDKNLCEEVKTINTLSNDGNAMSKDNCIKAIETNDYLANNKIAFNDDKFLKKMGYTEKDTAPFLNENGLVDYSAFYRSVINTEDFKKRLESLPDFSKE